MALFDELYPIGKKELKKASKVLANAFSEDPIINKMDLSSDFIESMYEIPIRSGLRYGEVYATSENFEGIIAFTPSKYANMKMWNIIRSGAIIPALKLRKKLGEFMQQMTEILEEDKKNLDIGPYLYLFVIGVSLGFQGKGYGGKMLRALIEKAENERKSIYLETETKENVNLYKKFGFEVIKKFTIPNLNLPMWEMVRNGKKN